VISKEGAKGIKTAFPDDLIMQWNKSIFWRRPGTNISDLSNPKKNLPFCQYSNFFKKIIDKNIKNNPSFSIY